MEASPAQVIQYFNGEKQNLIPLFQRPYSWSLPNWKTLWDDVLVQYDADEKSAHFMGTIVSVPARSVPVGVSKYLIIDGQQRLTTVSILLCALRDTLDTNSSDRIQEVYLTNRFRDPEDTLKFVPTQVDRDRYRSMILDRVIPNDHSLMSEAYAYFKKQLLHGVDPNGDSIDCAKVLTTVERALQVVMINLGDDDDPYLIFESLNFKGEPLTQADLVRNYVLMRFRHSMSAGGEQERIYKRYWAPMEDRLGDNITEFLRHYAMKNGDNVYQRGIYAATKALLKGMAEPSDVEAELEQMTDSSMIYASILDPSLEQTPSIRKRLENLKSLGVGTSYPLLLRLFQARNSDKIGVDDLEKCLGLLESFVVRRAVSVVPTNALNKLFLQWARQFPAADHVAWLLASMSAGAGGRRFPTDTEFGDNFKNLAQYGRGYTRYVLLRLEEAFGHKEHVDLTNVTIEHIMPQTMTNEWAEEVGPQAVSVHTRLKDTFGNLSLTGYNTELGNLSFCEKKSKLANTHIELNRSVLKEDRWDEQAIMRRACWPPQFRSGLDLFFLLLAWPALWLRQTRSDPHDELVHDCNGDYVVPLVPGNCESGKKAGQEIQMPTTHELGRYPHLKLSRSSARKHQRLGTRAVCLNRNHLPNLNPARRYLSDLNSHPEPHGQLHNALVQYCIIAGEFLLRPPVGRPSHPFGLRWKVPLVRIKAAD